MGSCEMWCWRRVEKISCTDHVRNEEELFRVKEQRNILQEMSKRKVNWIGHILCRNCLLQQVIEGKVKGGIEVTGRRGRRRSKLLDDLQERIGYSHLKEEALDRTMERARFGRGFGFCSVARAAIYHVFFPHCLIIMPIFRGAKKLLNAKCVLIFYAIFVSKNSHSRKNSGI
jgi:hypothetical protein